MDDIYTYIYIIHTFGSQSVSQSGRHQKRPGLPLWRGHFSTARLCGNRAWWYWCPCFDPPFQTIGAVRAHVAGCVRPRQIEEAPSCCDNNDDDKRRVASRYVNQRRPTDRPTDQNQPTNQPINQPTNQPTNESNQTNQADGRTDGRMLYARML